MKSDQVCFVGIVVLIVVWAEGVSAEGVNP